MIRFFIRVLNKLKLLKWLNLTTSILLNGRKLKIPVVKSIGVENIHMSEPWMIKLLEKILAIQRDGVYVDVGVNIGQTLLKLKSVNNEIPYVGFEPNPTCVFYTTELIKRNNFQNVTLFPFGISDKTGVEMLSFYFDSTADSSASMIGDFRPKQRVYHKEYIPCFHPSEILEKYNIPKIGVIKIDVEGAEWEVINGFRDRIISDQPIIQLEILPVHDPSNVDRLKRQEAIEDFFRTIAYVKFRVLSNEKGELESIEQIDKIGIHSNLKWCEYVALPEGVVIDN
jgi:FkbM family methyltransferase